MGQGTYVSKSNPAHAARRAAAIRQPTSAMPTPRTKAYRLLRDYGVTEQAILPLIRAHSDSEIERQVAHLDFE